MRLKEFSRLVESFDRLLDKFRTEDGLWDLAHQLGLEISMMRTSGTIEIELSALSQDPPIRLVRELRLAGEYIEKIKDS